MQKTTISIIVSLLLVGGALYVVSDDPAPSDTNEVTQSQNVQTREGVQYVTITAKGGYTPYTTQIAGGVSTKLIVKTDGTYDCSAALVVRSVGFRKMLRPSGEEVIDLGVLKPGEEVTGVCGMGMYNFKIKVS